MSRITTIDDRIEVSKGAKHQAERMLADLALKSVEANTPEVQAQIKELQQEIAQHDAAISTLELAKTQAAARDTDDAKRAELQRLKSVLAEVAKRSDQQLAAAQKIVELIDALSPALAEYEQLANDQRADVFSIVKAARPAEIDRRFPQFAGTARGAAANAAIINALWASGVGRKGLHLESFVQVTHVEEKYTLRLAMKHAEKTMLRSLQDLIDRRAAEVNGTASAPEAGPSAEDRYVKGGKKAQARDSFVSLRDKGAIS